MFYWRGDIDELFDMLPYAICGVKCSKLEPEENNAIKERDVTELV